VKRVVLLGGGHSHIEVVRRCGAQPVPNAEITLVDAERFATYSGMLPGLIAGHYDFNDCHIDLARLAQRAGVRFVQSRARGIDTPRRQLELGDGGHLDYDLLSIDVGSTPPTAGIPGAADHAITVKPFAAFAQHWDRLIARARAGRLQKIVAVGGGAASVEVLLAMQYRLAQLTAAGPVEFALVTDARCVLPDHNAGTRAAIERLLSERGIALHLHVRVARVEPAAVVLSDAKRIAADAIIWATGAGAPTWLLDTGLAVDARGFIAIDEHLSSVSHADVFAAGDCATMAGHNYPKSGVYAVRQGPLLAENLHRALSGRPLANYRPQRLALSLISAGNRYAIASYGPFALAGAWVWRWKNHIDRKFVKQYYA
jgi:selenide,water dikinase